MWLHNEDLSKVFFYNYNLLHFLNLDELVGWN